MTDESNARSTIEFIIRDALSKYVNNTGDSIRYADVIVPDIIDSLFHPSTAWAVREYLKEIGEYETYAEKEKDDD